MGKIIFSADSAVDLTDELIKELDLKIIPIAIILGNEERADGVDISPEEIYEFVEKTKIMPKTSAVSSYAFKEHFESIRSPGDSILHFSISAKLSACHQNAVTAAAELKDVHVIDGHSLSTGTALLLFKAVDLAKKGFTAAQIAEECRNTAPFVQASFVVDSLEYLYKGGRCSGLQLLGANLLKIHPMLQLQDGFIKVGGKFRGGLDRVWPAYIDYLKQNFNPDLTRAFFTNSVMTSDLHLSIMEKVKKEFGFKELYNTQARATVNCHCGKNTLGLLFINKDPIVKN